MNSMNEMVLSQDLNIIVAEINSFKQVAGQSIFEIGKRLKHVRENDLVHGQWEAWLNSVDISKTAAWNMMQAYDQFSNVQTSELLPTGKIFEMLSLPASIDRQDFLTESHTIPSTGETKTVEDMTVREIREVKKLLAESERAKEAAEQAVSQSDTKYAQLQQSYDRNIANLETEIDQLKKSKTKDSPETLKRIAELEAEVVAKEKLGIENARLQLEMKTMQQGYEEKLTQHDEEVHAMRELNKSLRTMITTIIIERTNSEYHFRLLKGHRVAYEAIQSFLDNFDVEVKKVFDLWRNDFEIGGEGKHERFAVPRTGQIIEISGGSRKED